MKKILPVLIFLALIIGCKKDRPIVLINQNLLLSSAISVNVKNEKDTLSITKYKYDSNNRITGSIYYLKLPNEIDTTVYTYDNSGNLITVNFQTGFPEFDRKQNGSNSFTYLNGMPYSFENPDLDYMHYLQKYTLVNNKVAALRFESWLDTITYDGNNIKTIISGKGYGNDTAASGIETFNYGTKKDPFFIGGYKWYLSAVVNIPLSGQNVITSIIQSDYSGYHASDTYTYIYNSAGYPVKASEYYSQNGTQTTLDKITYYNYIPAK